MQFLRLIPVLISLLYLLVSKDLAYTGIIARFRIKNLGTAELFAKLI